MEDADSVATLIDSTTSKIQQLQRAFAELESYRAVTLNLKWKELEEHFHGLEKSLKRRFHELEDQEKEFENKTMKARELLEKREADVFAKEQASLQKLQEKRDDAVFAIVNAREKHRKVSSRESTIVSNGDKERIPRVEEKPMNNVFIAAEGNMEDVKLSPENGNVELMSYPELVKLCKEVDAAGLHKFISDNRKNLAALREEIPHALGAAPSAACLVLDSLEGFYCMEVSSLDVKKDANLLGLRRTCIMLMECLSDFLSSSDCVSDVISEDIKDRAKAVAEEWKPRLDALDMDASNGNSLEAHAFLQLLASFGIASGFDKEELFRLIPMVSRRRQTADLCRFLGLSEKMPGVIEVLVNSGRQIDAVNLAFAFDLTEQFSPVSLLKSYLKDARKASSPVKSVNSSPTAQIEVNERELIALKAVIKCVEEHKLDEQYPLDPLQKRLLQLEKAKADKKRETEATKPQPKRPRANGVGYGPRVTNIPSDKTCYARVADRYPQYVYDRPYMYPAPTENHCPPLLSTATYNLSPSHGNYFANGYQYQATYLH
ncbi:FRIGIDA-like protein 3 isoform X2 [Abrus precatorius]|nr:FRIGIDA-like protein 3 isoform X2 [Abrus precatorius]XP_027337931.1 FRIGIDA-like protein 3 isoform X2 [Abrus precatorius]XP_027337932.1 FRIGIDA-like protein 3 isoform X2 [Abrus precatorius]XP_027337933.1 FRIGIDA-like protein 3 isoform X2 [Abrus precatorius]XP_027337934.1 FRIGIDA-like protein 3 isoform X2 [Abrus precatorius]